MLSTFTIKNYKSIVDVTLELGRFNVFIGENGAGKTNVLEALAMAAGAGSNRLTNEDLVARGVRVARAGMTLNAFVDHELSDHVDVSVVAVKDAVRVVNRYSLTHDGSRWVDAELVEDDPKSRAAEFVRLVQLKGPEEAARIVAEALSKQEQQDPAVRAERFARKALHEDMRDYGIYCADTLALRGLQVESHREPLGLYGEALDVVIAQLPDDLRARVVEHARVIAWFDGFDVDREGRRKLEGHKPGRSRSDLYFVDRFLSEENKLFSAENANEGILHLLFYLVLFIAPGTPRLFAIDNIETALNPHLLRHLVKTLAQLAKDHDRQALVTTHNPAALDGLDLRDDDQRLFVVYRSDEGHTKVRRVAVKPQSPAGGPKLKLSELWMRGMLGAIPTHF